MKSKKITVFAPEQYLEDIACLLNEYGSQGESIYDNFTIKQLLNSSAHWDYVEESLLKPILKTYVCGYFDTSYDEKPLLKSITQYGMLGGLEVTTKVELIDSKDWENEWKKYYVPLEINNVVIVPQWIDYDQGKKAKVILDPGLAFGTGSHETTSMCIELMQLFDLKSKSCLDVGCGSGILGITAIKLGAERCDAIDNDFQAVASAKANAQLNRVANQLKVVNADLCNSVQDTYDLVLANLTADLLIKLQPDIDRILKDKIIISGIIEGRQSEVLKAYEKYTLVKSLSNNGWFAYLFQRGAEI